MISEKARWIWTEEEIKEDIYRSFKTSFVAKGGCATLSICSEMNYVAYLNGEVLSFGQFPNYKNEKYFDEIPFFASKGENELLITVRYEGYNSATHVADRGGLLFSVEENGETLAFSSEKTLGAIDNGYVQGEKKYVTSQLGYVSSMIGGAVNNYAPCVEVDLTYNVKPRPVKKLVVGDKVYGEFIERKKGDIYDLKRETAGYMFVNVNSGKETVVTVTYGEHLVDGDVRHIIENRTFEQKFFLKKGENKFVSLFQRVACRYLEVYAEDGVKVEEIGLIPVDYPFVEKKRDFELDQLDAKIYEVSARTLTLCAHEHYEDCPWREQALYVLDSRNQALCGYYAFEGHDFQRANLAFIAKGVRPDGLLELTYPATKTGAIPFFSIMYPVEVFEYVEHTGDKSLVEEVMPTMRGIMNFFADRIEGGALIENPNKPYWNFYEWAEGSYLCEAGATDLILNCAFVYSAERYKKLCSLVGETFDVDLDNMKNKIRETFYDAEKGTYFLSSATKNLYSQLGAAFAILIGLDGKNVAAAARGENGVIPATLSMLGFVYDALLLAGDKDFVLSDIRKKYGYMLDNGATSFWETIVGEADFAGAGSLCHGWSAMPLYYYNLLIGGKK